MRQRKSLQRRFKRAVRIAWSLLPALFPPASLATTLTGCAGSACKFQCGTTSVCLTGGCFHDDQSQCADYPPASEWTTSWEKGASINCQRTRDASGKPLSVSCVGTQGEAQQVSCSCTFVEVNGVLQCG